MMQLDRLLQRIEAALLFGASLCLFAVMAIVSADVLMRYILRSPFEWTQDIVGLYLLAGVFFLALPGTTASRNQIAVDILSERLSPAWRRVTDAIGALIGLAVWAAIGWLGWERMVESYVGDDRLIGATAWPTWIADILVPIGAAFMALRLIYNALGQVLSLITRQAVIPEPARHAVEGTAE